MSSHIDNFFTILSFLPGLYWVILYILLLLYVIASWLGRLNKKIKNIVFDSPAVDTWFHIFRYTILPSIILIIFTIILVKRIYYGNMDYHYGSIKILIIFIVGIIWFLGAWIISSIQKKRAENGDLGFAYKITAILSCILFPLVALIIVFLLVRK
ncbi:hypothetical protein E4O06_02595 [Treponema sp. OMZ 789]|nr:hypothetical protein E4O06_02595 [Treponema sp. OMZ 789]UTC70305.1 hypothetical protein E4O01_02585 [Treponema sp. OMZ 790]UTC73020.1 hypothetical protein E4O02_02585 [Treponema sp. OMZ 791]